MIGIAWRTVRNDWLAERVGFEPTIRFPVYTLSKRAPSATRPSLRDSPTLKRLTPLYSGAPGGQAKAGPLRDMRGRLAPAALRLTMAGTTDAVSKGRVRPGD